MKAMIILTAFLEGGVETQSPAAIRAKALASQMFEAAGVELRWCRPKSCPVDAVAIRFIRPGVIPAAVAGRAYVFRGDRVDIDFARVTGRRPLAEAQAVLAHVMVHELTHILQGCDHHSREGIMKAHWTRIDLASMTDRPLAFTELDVELIHAGASRRGELVSVVK